MATILELAQLSAATYGDELPPPGWIPVGKRYGDGDGYLGIAYANPVTHEIVIANRGTRGLDHWSDLKSDLAAADQATFPAQTDAENFAKTIARRITSDPQFSGYSLIETGHSLGGNEAQAAVEALTDKPVAPGLVVSGVTFNAPGVSQKVYQNHANPQSYNVLNLYTQGDWIHTAGGTHLGTSASLAAGPSYLQEFGDFEHGLSAGEKFGPEAALVLGGGSVAWDVLRSSLPTRWRRTCRWTRRSGWGRSPRPVVEALR